MLVVLVVLVVLVAGAAIDPDSDAATGVNWFMAGIGLLFLLAPEKAVRPLDAVRTFMADNNAVIMMMILVLLGAKLLVTRSPAHGADGSVRRTDGDRGPGAMIRA